VDERELDRLEMHAERSYDFRLDNLIRDLRSHRSMLRRYATAHLYATRAKADQLPAATHALLEAYNDTWKLLGEPAPRIVAESPNGSVTGSGLGVAITAILASRPDERVDSQEPISAHRL
jgi:hypothetical protein